MIFTRLIDSLKNIHSKFEKKIKFKKFLYISICVLLAIYLFSIPTFSNRSTYQYITYGAMILLFLFNVIYLLLFELVKIDIKTLFLPLFVLSALVGTLLYTHSFRDYLTLILVMASFYTIYASCLLIKNQNLYLLLFIFTLFLFSVIFIFHYREEILNIKSYEGEEFRLGSYYLNPNRIGILMTFTILIVLYTSFFNSKKRYLFLLLTLPIFFFVGFTTGSRTFLLTAGVVVLLMIFMKLRKHWLILLLVFVGLTIIFIILLQTPFLATVKFRISDTLKIFFTGGDGSLNGSTLERLTWQNYALELGARSMLFGWGENGFRIVSGVATYSHSNFPEMLCNFGFIGFILYYVFVSAPFSNIMFYRDKKEKYFIIAFLVVIFFLGFTTVFYYDKEIYLLMAICYALTSPYTIIEGYKIHRLPKKERNHYDNIKYQQIIINEEKQ